MVKKPSPCAWYRILSTLITPKKSNELLGNTSQGESFCLTVLVLITNSSTAQTFRNRCINWFLNSSSFIIAYEAIFRLYIKIKTHDILWAGLYVESAEYDKADEPYHSFPPTQYNRQIYETDITYQKSQQLDSKYITQSYQTVCYIYVESSLKGKMKTWDTI